MEAIEERVNGLEAALEQFMVTSNRIIRRMEERTAENNRMIKRMDERALETERMIERMDQRAAETERMIKRMDQRAAETERMIERMDERAVETERMIERMDEKIAVTDRGIAEMRAGTDRSIAETRTETDRSIEKMKADTDRSIERMKADTDRSIEKMKGDTDRSIEKMKAETDRSIAEMKEESRKHTFEMARIADRVGRFAEDIVAPNIPRIAEEVFGVSQIEFEAPRVKRRHSRDRSRLREFDVVVAGNRHLLVTSVKATARNGDIAEFVAALKDIFEYFPEYRGYALVPIFASMALSKSQLRRLTRLKIFAMALGQRTMELLNLEQVRALRVNRK